MILKQFLKPDWRKIVIFIIVLIVIYFLPIYPCQTIISPWMGRPRHTKTEFIPVWYVISKRFNWGIKSDPLQTWNCNPLFILFLLIVLYLLSCLIIWIYDKVKKKS